MVFQIAEDAGYSHTPKTGGVKISLLILAFLLIVENVAMEKLPGL